MKETEMDHPWPLISCAEHKADSDVWQIEIPRRLNEARFHFQAFSDQPWLVDADPALPEKATAAMAEEGARRVLCSPAMASQLWATMVHAFRRACSKEHLNEDNVPSSAHYPHETPAPKGFRRVKLHPTQDPYMAYPEQWTEMFNMASEVTVSKELAQALLRGQGLSQDTIDLRFSIDGLLQSRGVRQIDGPAAACFWAGDAKGSWVEYIEYANGSVQCAGAPRMRDSTLGGAASLIANAVRTFAILLDNRHARGEPMPCAVVWRRRPEIGLEDDGALYWRARCAFVPVAVGALSLDRPEWVDPISPALTVSAPAETAPSGEIGDGVALTSISHPHSADCDCTICHPPRRVADDYDGIRERLAAIKEGW